METQGGITVQRALELPGLRGGLPEVVAGADRLHRTVRWVHAGEVPNIASLLKGGELLLTTGLRARHPARRAARLRPHASPTAASPRSSWSWARASARLPGGARGDGAGGRSAARAAAPRGALRLGHGGDPHRDRQRPLRAAAAGRGGAPALYGGAARRGRGAPGAAASWPTSRAQPGLPGDRGRTAAVRGRLRVRAGRRRSAPGVGGAARPARGTGVAAGRDGPGGRPGRRPGTRLRYAPGWSCWPSAPRCCRCTGWRPSGRPGSWPSS